MPYIQDYLARAFDTFDERPLSPVDSAILTQACMLDAPAIVPAPSAYPGPVARAAGLISATASGVRFQDLARAEHFEGMFRGLVPKDIRELLFALIASPRFRDLRIANYRSVFDEETHTQFAAMTFTWHGRRGRGFSYVAFRGTDVSLTGWRENFDMTYRRTVRAQELAHAYLDEVGPRLGRHVHVGGHSKGGNLALFAALGCAEGVRARIERVWCHDAPGFMPGRFTEADYARLAGRVERFVPEDSVVGMLLDSPYPLRCVVSDAAGIDQHSVFTWRVEDGDFVYRDRPHEGALALHDVMDAWLAQMDLARREQVVEALFAAIAASGVEDAREILCNDQQALHAVIEAARRIDPVSRDVLTSALGDLAALAAWRAGRDMAQALFGWMR